MVCFFLVLLYYVIALGKYNFDKNQLDDFDLFDNSNDCSNCVDSNFCIQAGKGGDVLTMPVQKRVSDSLSLDSYMKKEGTYLAIICF